jgi:hypothetical protein
MAWPQDCLFRVMGRCWLLVTVLCFVSGIYNREPSSHLSYIFYPRPLNFSLLPFPSLPAPVCSVELKGSVLVTGGQSESSPPSEKSSSAISAPQITQTAFIEPRRSVTRGWLDFSPHPSLPSPALLSSHTGNIIALLAGLEMCLSWP